MKGEVERQEITEDKKKQILWKNIDYISWW